MLSPPSFSLFIACAIMRQLKEYLMPLDFNACIHMFSSLPAVNIEECLKDAKEIMNVTPPSVTTLNENSVSDLKAAPNLDTRLFQFSVKADTYCIFRNLARGGGNNAFQSTHWPRNFHRVLL